MVKPLVLIQLLAVFTLAGCADQRYQWNLAHQHLSPKVQKMPEADVRTITRLVSERCSAPIICISRGSDRDPTGVSPHFVHFFY